jgi:hypothetical protein
VFYHFTWLIDFPSPIKIIILHFSMDARSRLDHQRARLRERLQDLSARSAAALPSGSVAGGVQEGLPYFVFDNGLGLTVGCSLLLKYNILLIRV